MRLFVAIPVSDAARRTLAAAQKAMQPRCPGVRWVPPEQLHMTVKFLGETPDNEVDRVSLGIMNAAAGQSPFGIKICGAGCFPEGGPVRIVWAGAEEQSGALDRVIEGTEREMEFVGFAREYRAFSPHITLGRVRDDRSRGALRGIVTACTIGPVISMVDSLTLMLSEQSPQGSIYRPVTTVRLSG